MSHSTMPWGHSQNALTREDTQIFEDVVVSPLPSNAQLPSGAIILKPILPGNTLLSNTLLKYDAQEGSQYLRYKVILIIQDEETLSFINYDRSWFNRPQSRKKTKWTHCWGKAIIKWKMVILSNLKYCEFHKTCKLRYKFPSLFYFTYIPTQRLSLHSFYMLLFVSIWQSILF